MVSDINTCIECTKRLVGRSDKKFCNDHCRNSYHTKKNRDWNNYMRNINHILRKNRQILLELYQNNKNIVSKDFLVIQGFQYTFCTSSKQQNEQRYYYDFRLTPINQMEYKIEYLETLTLLQTG